MTDWTFKSTKIAESFDSHVREQLPWYDLATGMVAHFARHFLPENGLMYDIGASTGNIYTSLESEIISRNIRYIGIDNSDEMCQANKTGAQLVICDAIDYDYTEYDLCICFLIVMFLPVGQRIKFIKNLANKIKPGGALIIFDKEESHGGYIGTIFNRLTIAGKIANNADPSEILKKELSLSGVQRPLPCNFSKFIFPEAIQIFKFCDFVGYIIVRQEA